MVGSICVPRGAGGGQPRLHPPRVPAGGQLPYRLDSWSFVIACASDSVAPCATA